MRREINRRMDESNWYNETGGRVDAEGESRLDSLRPVERTLVRQ